VLRPRISFLCWCSASTRVGGVLQQNTRIYNVPRQNLPGFKGIDFVKYVNVIANSFSHLEEENSFFLLKKVCFCILVQSVYNMKLANSFMPHLVCLS
jgi:hypothetical protein